jgi:NitT/TauT family transport system substrate-binding protein
VLFLISVSLSASCTNPATYITTTTDSAAASDTPASTATGTANLGFSAWPGWFPWQVAQEQKLFEANRVTVGLKWFDGYQESINTLSAQQINANSQTLNDTISAVSGGADQVVVLVNDNSTGNDKVVVRKGINTIADLKGKKWQPKKGQLITSYCC